MEPQRIAEFHKVSLEEFIKRVKVVLEELDDVYIERMYDRLKTPERKTEKSAAYDFHLPFKITLNPGESIMIPTGFKCEMDDDWCLNLYSRSGLGTRNRLRLNTCVSIVDADYYNNPDNEGHILAKITNEGQETVELAAGAGFIQGKFAQYGITRSDNATGVRVGGFGSTESK